ncbi:hypothetical protein HK102_007896 [Quaeritorhiza haematococci]|nr:hypothetical protein HK102_007896 [Quaeritorhiza haematococci]
MDGVNLNTLNTEAQTRVAKLAARIKSLIILTRCIGAPINLILFSLGAYYHAIKDIGPQITCTALGILSVVVNLVSVAFINHWSGRKLVRLLKKTVYPYPSIDIGFEGGEVEAENVEIKSISSDSGVPRTSVLPTPTRVGFNLLPSRQRTTVRPNDPIELINQVTSQLIPSERASPTHPALIFPITFPS